MTTVTSGEYTRRRYQWTVPVPFGRGAVIGDVQDAIGMAASTYESVTGGRTSSDDWLRIAVGDEEVAFWFEVDEQADNALPRDARRRLRSLISILEEGQQRSGNMDGPAIIDELKGILRLAAGGAA